MAKMVLLLMALIQVMMQEIQLRQQEDIKNGDGKDDIIIGTPDANSAGQAYIIYGQANFASPLSLASLNGTNGLITGVAALGLIGSLAWYGYTYHWFGCQHTGMSL